MTRLLALIALTLAPLSYAVEPDTAPDPTIQDDPVYWSRTREGWFWYREPPPTAPRPKPHSREDRNRPPELQAFERMQARLEELKRIAVMNPTDANLSRYMRFQRAVMDRSEHFAQRWQQLVWTTPVLDYGLTGRPTNATAIRVYDDRRRDRQEAALRSLAGTHALLFVFRGDCPYCHRFAPILKAFAAEYGLLVFPVSLDGGTLPEFPNPQTDNGIAARLGTDVVPALYLTAPGKREIQPVGFGLLARTDLIERIARLAAPFPERTAQHDTLP